MRPGRPSALERYLPLILAAALLALALSACGSSSSGSSTSAPPEAEAKAPAPETEAAPEETSTAAEPEASGEEAEETGGSAEIASIMRREIYGRWGGTNTEFDVAGGACKIAKINTTPAEIKAGGEAILDHERDASVLVTPIKGGGATAKECQEAVAIAIG
ncbi:MAG TPA: hypothetical protein VGC32_15705 [Solirubrobacterales bacterium]